MADTKTDVAAQLKDLSDDELRQLLASSKQSSIDSLLQAKADSLKDLWMAIGAYTHLRDGTAAAGDDASKPAVEDKEGWEEFKLLYSSSIKALVLPSAPSAPSPTKDTPASTSAESKPAEGQPSSASSKPDMIVKPPSATAGQGQGALPTSVILPPPSPPLSPSSPNLAALAALPLIKSMVPPAPDPSASASGSRFFPPSPPPEEVYALQHQSLSLPLVSPFAKSLYPLPPLPADVSRRSAAAAASSSGRSTAGSRGAGSVSSRKGRAAAAGATAGQEGVDLTRWYAQVNANPVWKLVGGARKCLGSDDWATAHQELRFLRAMARIEQLKQEGRWSFRQPKKQKGPPVGKSSWDWMLEEMKWLQTDFREERKWKIAACWELSQAVLEFHHARDKRDVCVRVGGKWALPVGEAAAAAADDNVEVEGEGEPADAGEEAQDELPAAEAQEEELGVAARLKRRRRGEPDESPAPTPVAEPEDDDGEAMDVDAEGEPPADKEQDDDADDKDAVELEVAVDGEGEDEDAVGEPMDEDEDAAAAAVPPAAAAVTPAAPADAEVLDKKPVIGTSTSTPIPRHDDLPTPPPDAHPSDLGASAAAAQLAAEAAAAKAERLAQQHHQLRSALATLAPSALTLDFAPFFDAPPSPPAEASSSSTPPAAAAQEDAPRPPSELSHLALQELFGDIAPYVPPMPLSPSLHAQGKIDRRIDDATASGGKLAHTSRLMDIRPVLVSTLNPGRKRKGERWDDLSDLWGGAEDLRDLAEMKGEVYSSGIPLFAGKKVRDSAHLPILVKPPLPRNFETRLASTIWQPDDDAVLQRLCLQFPFNWQLISDAFNTARRTLSIDRRSPWDCYQRWNKKWNPNKEADLPPDVETEGTASPGGTISRKMAKVMPALLDAKYEGSKKKLRHAKLYEAMRKTAKRRDITNRKPNLKGEPRRVLTAHESHHAFVASRPGTPQELSQAKYERDRAYHEREQHEHQARQHAMYRAIQARQQGQVPQNLNVPRPASTGQQQHPSHAHGPPGAHPGGPNVVNGPGGSHLGPGSSASPVPRPPPTAQQQAAHLAALAQRAAAAATAGGGRMTAAQLGQMQAIQAAQRAAAAAAAGGAPPGGGGGTPLQQRTGTPVQQLQQQQQQQQHAPPNAGPGATSGPGPNGPK